MIKSLAIECLRHQPKLNNLVELLSILVESDNNRIKCFGYLQKIFRYYYDHDLFANKNQKVKTFLWNKLYSFTEIITIFFMNTQDNDQKVKYFDVILEAIKIDQSYNKTNIIKSLLKMLENNQKKQQFWKYLDKFQVLISIIKQLCLNQYSNQLKVSLIINMLPLQNISFESFYKQKSLKRGRQNSTIQNQADPSLLKKQYQNLLISVLKDKNLNITVLNSILLNMGDNNIYKKIQKPIMLSEFLIFIYQNHSNLEIKVNALSALYILVGKYQLQMDNYYGRLLQLIRLKNQNGKSIFEIEGCKRIYRLIENSLRSSKVPFEIIERFVKNLMELVFEHSSEFSFWITALVFNLIKKHRNLLKCIKKQQIKNIMIDEIEKVQNSNFYFYEFDILKNHYLPEIRAVIKQLNKNLNSTDYLDIEEFSNMKLQKVLNKKLEQFEQKHVVYELNNMNKLID